MHRIQRHLLQVAEDDALLLKEDMGKGLTEAELQEALEERGMYVIFLFFVYTQAPYD